MLQFRNSNTNVKYDSALINLLQTLLVELRLRGRRASSPEERSAANSLEQHFNHLLKRAEVGPVAGALEGIATKDLK